MATIVNTDNVWAQPGTASLDKVYLVCIGTVEDHSVSYVTFDREYSFVLANRLIDDNWLLGNDSKFIRNDSAWDEEEIALWEIKYGTDKPDRLHGYICIEEHEVCHPYPGFQNRYSSGE